MRPFFLLFLTFFCLSATANTTYEKLCEVNACWKEKPNYTDALLPQHTSGLNETEWIQLHLSLVEKELRNRSTAHLTAMQRQNRQLALDYLHGYWQAARFPQNEDYSYRTPIFIDKHENFCAVGYLVKATGHEQVSRMISAQTNLAYVREMNYPELTQWARDYGFTTDELAWIQPTYPPMNTLNPVGKGTDGVVYELFADTLAGNLYVGGSFSKVDSVITTDNIAYITENNGSYIWHSMGTGINGTVYAICRYGNNVFAGGQFTSAGSTTASNVAMWDGTTWQTAGCLSGVVNNFAVFGGNLYAAGDFDLCNTSGEVNFARWTGTGWQAIAGLTGAVNTMEVVGTDLLLGGNFTYGTAKNIIRWNANNGFQAFSNSINNEVKDIQMVFDTVYAVCKQSSTIDSVLLHSLRNNDWIPIPTFFNTNGTQAFNAICVLEDTCLVGGNFYQPRFSYVYNCFNMVPANAPSYTQRNYFSTDSTINKLAVFNNKIFAGGFFTNGHLNSIGVRQFLYPSYPPIVNARIVKSACSNRADGVVAAFAYNGAPPYHFKWSTGDTTQSVSGLLPGPYKVMVTDRNGKKDSSTVTLTRTVIDTNVVTGPDRLTSVASVDTFKWMDCANGLLPNESNAYLDIKKTGSYAVIWIKDSGNDRCIDTSRCYNFIPSNVQDIAWGSDFRLYPNPAHDALHLELGQETSAFVITLTDVTGRAIITKDGNMKNHISLSLKNLPAGVYTLTIANQADGRRKAFKVVKE